MNDLLNNLPKQLPSDLHDITIDSSPVILDAYKNEVAGESHGNLQGDYFTTLSYDELTVYGSKTLRASI